MGTDKKTCFWTNFHWQEAEQRWQEREKPLKFRKEIFKTLNWYDLNFPYL